MRKTIDQKVQMTQIVLISLNYITYIIIIVYIFGFKCFLRFLNSGVYVHKFLSVEDIDSYFLWTLSSYSV